MTKDQLISIDFGHAVVKATVVEESGHGLTVKARESFDFLTCLVKEDQVIFFPWHRVQAIALGPEQQTL